MTAIEFLDQMSASESSRRTKRQILAVKKWVLSNCEGTCEWPTGTGKTRIATSAIQVMRREGKEGKSVLIVVPTLQLQEQWKEGLDLIGLSSNSNIKVINSVVRSKGPDYECDLLILDRFCPDKTYLIAGNFLESMLLTDVSNDFRGRSNYSDIVKRHRIEQSAAKGPFWLKGSRFNDYPFYGSTTENQ